MQLFFVWKALLKDIWDVMGVPQGSMLDLLLFVLNISDLSELLNFSSSLSYVNDAVIFLFESNITAIYKNVTQICRIYMTGYKSTT